MSGLTGQGPRVEATGMKTSVAYAGRRVGRERETLRQTPHPKLRAPRSRAGPRRGSVLAGDTPRVRSNATRDQAHELAAASRMRSAASAGSSVGVQPRAARPAPASGFAHAQRGLGARPRPRCSPRGPRLGPAGANAPRGDARARLWTPRLLLSRRSPRGPGSRGPPEGI